MTDHHDLTSLGKELLGLAAESTHGLASRAVIHGSRQRAVLMAFTPGAALGEHEAPPAATFHVLRGRALLKAADQEWAVGAGELVPIPQERHSVEVPDEDTLVLLTVAVD
jgi:quercetin dioxygenase-like cupin family protein